VLDRTDSSALAEAADIFFARPLTIVVVLLVAWLAVRLLHRAIDRFVGSLSGDGQPGQRIRRGLHRTPIAERLPERALDSGAVSVRAAARAATLGNVLHSLATGVVWAIAALTILGEVGINLGPLVAGAGIVGVALGFGAQSLVQDFLAGIFILVEDQYGVGDIIDVGEDGGVPVSGTVESVSLRTTRLRSVNGTVWHVPNGTIPRVGNMSQQWARALLDISVGYTADIAQAQAVIKDVADEVWRDADWSGSVLEEPEVWGIEDLGADGVTIRLVVKTRPSEQFKVMRELRSRIKLALDAAGVEIPFPQRTVWVRRDPDDASAL
jgi:small conductance mechanosensitive channel